MKWLAALALILAGTSYAASVNKPLPRPDQQALRRAATEVRDAIMRHDIRRFLQRVSRSEGLGCTDRRIPYQQVGKDLQDRNSHLYISLFDSTNFSNRCGTEYPADYPAISDHEFFTRASNATVEIEPLEHGLAQVVIRSQTKGHYPREWLFQKEQGQWRLIDGFVISRCSCG